MNTVPDHYIVKVNVIVSIDDGRGWDGLMKLTNVHREIKLTGKCLRMHCKKRSRKANAILFPSQIRSVLVADDHPCG